MTDDQQDKGRASHAGYNPGPVPSEPESNGDEGGQESTAAAGAPDQATGSGGQHGRPEDDQDDGHS